MGRRAQGWKLIWRVGSRFLKQWESGAVAYVRFTYKSTPYLLSTGEGDQRKAAAACSRLYADVVQRGAPKASRVALSREPLTDLFARWLPTLEGVLDEKTVKTYEGYVGGHYLQFFEDLSEPCDIGRVRAYINQRLRVVLKGTVQKELSGLRGFLTWCRDEQLFTEMPAWVDLKTKSLFPSKARGKRSGPQREKANELTTDQVERFLVALLPLSERTSGGRRFPVRARFVVAYETGLRPATLDEALWSDIEIDAAGRTWFNIRDEIDKNRFGRRVPLSAIAAEELARLEHSRSDGLIFGRHDYRVAIKKASEKAGIDLRIAPYDFRHARGTHLIDAGAPLTAVAFLHGHTQVTTTNKYVHASDRQAAQWVDARSLPATPTTPLALPPAPPPPVAADPVSSPAATREGSETAEDARTLDAHLSAETVRRTGVEPVQELPRWILNPALRHDPAENKPCDESTSRHDSAGNVTGHRHIRTLIRKDREGLFAAESPWEQGVVALLGTGSATVAAARYVASEWTGGAS